MTDKIQKIRKEVERLFNHVKDSSFESDSGAFYYLKDLLDFIDSLQEEPVREDLLKASIEFAKGFGEWHYAIPCFQAGAEWQKQQDKETIELAEDHAMFAGMEKMKEQMMKNIWKPADGDDLPEIDREVIVLTQKYPLKGSEYAVSFAHRPYKGKYIGKSLTTGNIETFENETYGKGGWSIPDVKWWLDCGWSNKEGQ